jgi:hypothetical protein
MTAMKVVLEPDCVDCKHPAEEHNYDPSGMAGTACWHAEKWDRDGWPVGEKCGCTDYNPGDCD